MNKNKSSLAQDGYENLLASLDGVLLFAVRNANSKTFTSIAMFNATSHTTSVYVDDSQKGLTPFWGTQLKLKLVGLKPKLRVKVHCASTDKTRELLIPLLTEMGDESAEYRLDPDNEIIVS